MSQEIARRPLKSRAAKWPRTLAALLVRQGLAPNQISVASAVLSTAGAACLFFSAQAAAWRGIVLLLSAAACIQLRLVCNLVDGLMAVEGGLKTKAGEIFNEFPDRVADVLLLVAAGYSVRFEHAEAVPLGFVCAIASVTTAYVRVFGGAAGLPQDFCGPMAKQQRMFALTLACLASALETWLRWPHHLMLLALAIIFAGCLFTIARRTSRIAKLLNARPVVAGIAAAARTTR